MSRKRKIILAASLLFLAVLAAALGSTAIQAAPEAFSLSWWTVDNGGGTSAGGAYVLQGTIGQPDPGCLSGAGFTLDGGFWLCSQENHIYLPLVNR
jgi:hypothetical protein